VTVTEPAPRPTRRENPFNPPAELRLLRADRPVSRLAFPGGGEGWLVTRADEVRRVLIDPRFSSGHQNLSPVRAIPKDMRVTLPGLFIQMDPPEHTRYRRALTAQFTVARMRVMRDRIAEIVSDHLDAMDKTGSRTDLVAAFARPIPLLVICELLRIPAGPRAEFVRNTGIVGDRTSSLEALRAVVEGNRAAMREVIRGKRDEPDAGLISALVHEDEEARFTEDELVSIGLLLLVNGNESTANMLGLSVFALLEHPDQVDLLRADPTRWAGAVEELLRYLTVVQYGIVRIATAEVEPCGCVAT
jgi:cytochrome P450